MGPGIDPALMAFNGSEILRKHQGGGGSSGGGSGGGGGGGGGGYLVCARHCPMVKDAETGPLLPNGGSSLAHKYLETCFLLLLLKVSKACGGNPLLPIPGYHWTQGQSTIIVVASRSSSCM